MKRALLAIASFVLFAPLVWANQAAHGFCETGAQVVVTSGLTSTTQVQASFPSCTVTVFVHGGGLATIFSDNNNTPLSNPFTAQANGQWTWYAANGRYDVQMSGAGFPSPVTISDILLNDSGGGGGGGGAPPLGNNGDLQMKNSTVFAASHINDNGTLLNHSEDSQFKGPNPYVDLRSYGVRSVSISGTPVQAGITANMTVGLNTATVSTNNCPAQTGNVCFQNGDGVVVYGAGATNTLTTPAAPTVTPSLAGGATGVGDVVNAPTGAATYNYQIVLRDIAGGLTAASSVASTTTGQANLGVVQVNVTSLARVNTTVTVTTASPINVSVGATIFVTNSTDASFSGVQRVNSVTDSQHFTYVTGLDTRAGASASATGGTVQMYSCNNLTLPAYPTGGWQYYIYGRTGGSLTLIGVTKPLATFFEDYGSPMMDNITLPSYVPSSPPVSATNDQLSTTIVSGGGTTTLTLANVAINTVTGATIKLDHGPNLLTAIAANPNGIPLYVPTNVNLIINSITNIGNNVHLWQDGTVTLFETLYDNTAVYWRGDLGGNSNGAGQAPTRAVDVRTANPGFYAANSSSTRFVGLGFQISTQGLGIFFDDVGGTPFSQALEWCNFGNGNAGADYMGMAIVYRSASDNVITHSRFTASMPATYGITLTPLIASLADPTGIAAPAGSLFVSDSFIENRGIAFDSYPQGFAYVLVRLTNIYMSGNRTPLLILSAPQGGTITLDGIQEDTSTMAWVANLIHGSLSSVSVKILAYNLTSGEPGGAPGLLSGLPFISVTTNFQAEGTGTFPVGQNINLTDDSGNFYNNHVFVNNGGTIGYAMTSPTAPSLALSSGGSVPAGTWTYVLTALDLNSNETVIGPRTSVVVPGTCPGSGTCTVTITPPTAPVGSLQYNAYRSNGGGFAKVFGGPTNWGVNLVDNFATADGSPPTPAATSAGFTSTGTQTQALEYSTTLFANLGTPLNGTEVYCADCAATNPCTGSGTGAVAQRLNGAWICGASGGFTPVASTPLSCTQGAAFYNTVSQQFIFCPVANVPVTISGNIVQAQSAKTFFDGTVTNGSPTITSAGQAHFNCPGASYPCSTVGPGSDVGLKIFATNTCNGAQCDYTNDPTTVTILPSTQTKVGRIATVNSATSVTVDCNAPGNCVSPNASASSTAGDAVVLYGPDSTTALNNAIATASSTPGCPAVIIPQGIYFFNLPVDATAAPVGTAACNNNTLVHQLPQATQYNGGGGLTIVGMGTSSSVLVPTPDFTNPGAASGCFGGGSVNQTWMNFTVSGFGQSLLGAGFTPCSNLILMSSYNVMNVTFHGWGARAGGSLGVNATNGFNHLTNVEAFGIGGGSACTVSGPSTLVNVTCGVGGASGGNGALTITGAVQTSNSTWFAGNTNNSPQVEVQNGGVWESSNDTLVGAAINPGPSDDIKIDSGGIAYITNMLNSSGGANSKGIETVGTGKVWLTNYHHTGSSPGQSITNAGTLFDGGNNTFTGPITNTGNWAGTLSVTGVLQTSGNWSTPAGSGAGQWGTSPSVGTCTGFSTIEQCTITVGSSTVGANPVLTVTFPTSSLGIAGFPQTPSCDARMLGGTATFANFTTGTVSTVSAQFTYTGTPAASSTIILKVSCEL